MAKTNSATIFLSWRYNTILICIALAVLGLTLRVFSLAILKQHFLRHEGDERVLRVVNTPAFRGMIMDRNGFPLAVSTTVYSAWINPREFKHSKTDIAKIAALLKIHSNDILDVLANKKNREFVYLKRALSPQVASQLRKLNLPGLNLQQEYHRYYPEGEVTAHVIGFTNIDDQGQEGLELSFNDWLAGEQGKRWVIKDRLGQVISDVQTIKEQKPGSDLILSIDRRIQYLAYRELLTACAQNNASSGSAIVLDAKTGEILAMVNQPSYNPNNRLTDHSRFRNRAVTDLFEPGSTIKAFTIAAALESGLYAPDSSVDTSPGWMRIDRNMVRDEHNNGILSLAEILKRSSNMGAAKIALSLPNGKIWDMLDRVGFGESTAIGFPGEQNGTLIRRPVWGKFMLATLSFGYGLSTTILQLVRSYGILANNGVKVPLSLLKVDKEVTGQAVIPSEIAHQVVGLLEKGIAKTARIPGYRVAGKSGTSKQVGAEGYEKHYNSSYIGIAPVSNPRIIVAVIINDPQGKDYLGAKVSAPVFAKIMEGTLRLLEIPPDEGSAV